MTGLNLIGLMVMAAIAGIFHIRARMAGLAFNRPLAAMIQRKIVDRHTGRRPGFFRVAVLTLHPEEAGMDFWLGMALNTLRRRALKHFILMA